MTSRTLGVAALVALVLLTSASAASNPNALFVDPTAPNPCNIGPSFWCQSQENINRCMVSESGFKWLQPYGNLVGNAGYSTAVSPELTVQQLCKTVPTALQFNGGISGSISGYYGYLVLALTWTTTVCNATQTTGAYCSAYSAPGMYAETHLSVRGLWPDFGTIFDAATAPILHNTTGVYQGWPQYCRAPGYNFYQCNVNNAKNIATKDPAAKYANYTQSQLEVYVRKNGVVACQVPKDVMNTMTGPWKTYAPGFLGSNNTSLDQAWVKHGGCVGGYLSSNATAYFETQISLAMAVQDKGTVLYTYVLANAGKTVSRVLLESKLNNTGVMQCNSFCELKHVWMCYGRDVAGLPTKSPVTCPPGNFGVESCSACTSISVPTFATKKK